MGLIIAFILGMGNFACHSAVIQSGHRMLSGLPPATLKLARWSSLALEFTLLCGALLAVSSDHDHWVWLYAGYTLLNAGAAWALATGRM